MSQKYKKIPAILSEEDRLFVKLVGEGVKRSVAFRTSYPNHKSVMRYMDATKDHGDKAERARAGNLVINAAKTKVQTQKIHGAIVTFQRRMQYLAEKSLDVAEDLLENARSEKVKADLAIEFVRHEVGTPIARQAIKEEKTVYIGFGERPADRIIEAELI